VIIAKTERDQTLLGLGWIFIATMASP
jgi:hypothetical protein